MKRDQNRRAKRQALKKKIRDNDERIAGYNAQIAQLESDLQVNAMMQKFLEAVIQRTRDCDVARPEGAYCDCCVRAGLPLVVVPDPATLDSAHPWDVCEDCIGHVRARCGIGGTAHDDEDDELLCRFMLDSAIRIPP